MENGRAQDAEIFAVERRFYGAMEAADANTLDSLMAPQCLYFHSFGSQDSKSSYLQKVRAGHFRYRDLQFTQQSVMRRGNVAIVAGTLSGMVSSDGLQRRLDNVRISVWERAEARWQLLTFQPTPRLDR